MKALLALAALLLIQVFFSFATASAQTLTEGRIAQVKDGDTVVVAPGDGGQYFICRLAGIDAPELGKNGRPGQQYGEDAARQLKQMILGKSVTITLTGSKTYNRDVCFLSINNLDVNMELIRTGTAWAYRAYLPPSRPYSAAYLEAERLAKEERRGLWSNEESPVPPWEWRALNKN